MNQVSWLIYLADVVGNMGSFLKCVGVACVLAGIAFFICAIGFMTETSRWDYSDEKTAALKLFRAQRRTSVVCATFAFFFWFCSALTPSQNTVLAIAASQVGEQILQTKTATLAEQALNSWLQKQIEKGAPAPEPEKK